MRVVLRFASVAPLLLGLTGCLNLFGFGGDPENTVPPAERQLPASTQAMLAIKGMRPDAPIFIRIFKEESELEVWKFKEGRFQHFRTYPICAWSGTLGPKIQTGDRQSPEGFYTVTRAQMNPRSNYYLAFNLGYPNTHDQVNGHTGSALMVHGNCKSVGCYAMTDAYIEEIYILAREAFDAGQTKFHVQALPFRMTAANMAKHRDSPWYSFWGRLKEGYDSFEATGKPPIVKVCGKQYQVNVQFPGLPGDPAPDGPCPIFAKVDPRMLPGVDGVPQTVLANLNRAPDTAQPQTSQPVAVAAMAPQPPMRSYTPTYTQPATASAAPTQPAETAAFASMSASPVVRTPASRPVSIASMQATHPAASGAAPASGQAFASARKEPDSGAQPTQYQFGTTTQASATAPAVQQASAQQTAGQQTAAATDPDALQKTNRSGKGGKLASQPDAPENMISASPPIMLGYTQR
ncbi:L,D-transpeptidase family protein [Rhodomicrobium sp.]|uniref:L,D-transpeptidase family protein n=1 Tax=Rhodomicrobium sp. TaxID=2720632 RepID=UPI0039E29436